MDRPALNRRASQQQVDGEFVFRALQAFTNEILTTCRKSGTTVASIETDKLLAFQVPIPPLDVQRRIVAKLDALLAQSRAAREQLLAVPALVEKYRQSVLAAAFRGDLTAEWRKKNPDVESASKLLERIRAERRRRWEEAELAKMQAKGRAPKDDNWKAKYEEPAPVDTEGLPELPPGWAWTSADFCAWEITVGHVGPMKQEYVSAGVPFLRSLNVRANRFDAAELKFVTDEFHQRLEKSALAPGDLVVVRTGAPGTACVVPESLPVANCSDLVVVRLLKLVDPTLMAFFINGQQAKDQIFGMQDGVAQQHFNVGAMRKLVVPVMPLGEQAALRTAIEREMARAEVVHEVAGAQPEALGVLERALLAKAFRGELTT